jgi:hypothetical protein
MGEANRPAEDVALSGNARAGETGRQEKAVERDGGGRDVPLTWQQIARQAEKLPTAQIPKSSSEKWSMVSIV